MASAFRKDPPPEMSSKPSLRAYIENESSPKAFTNTPGDTVTKPTKPHADDTRLGILADLLADRFMPVSALTVANDFFEARQNVGGG